MFTDRLVVPGSFRGTADGYAFDVRLPWYRSLPLSCIDVAVTENGADVDRAAIRVLLDGNRRTSAELPDCSDTWWYVTDPMVVEVDRPASGPHLVLEVCIGTRIPYIVAGGQAVRLEERLAVSVSAGSAR